MQGALASTRHRSRVRPSESTRGGRRARRVAAATWHSSTGRAEVDGLKGGLDVFFYGGVE